MGRATYYKYFTDIFFVTDSGLAALSEPWHPIVYRVLVPSHLFAPSCNILSCTIVNATTFTEPPDLVP